MLSVTATNFPATILPLIKNVRPVDSKYFLPNILVNGNPVASANGPKYPRTMVPQDSIFIGPREGLAVAPSAPQMVGPA